MSQTNSSSIGFPAVLTIVFIILKLTHFITWSWWWVFAPLWISAAIGIVIWALAVLVMVLRDHHV
jgi:Transmembrane Fragile-X-F protein